MALPGNIDTGTAPNNGTGDPLRTGGQKINANFVYLDENKQDISEKGAANGYVGLNANVKIDNEYIQMPVIPVETVPTTGDENVLYAESSTKNLKVWNGASYDIYGGGGSGGGTWGSITGTLSDQTDLINALNNKESKRVNKEVTNTTQYTVVATDFTDSQLDFTGVPSNETINVIVNENVCPNTDPSTGLQIVVHPASKISFSGTANLVPQPGAVLTSANDGSSVAIIGVKPTSSINDLGTFGTLESDGTGGGGIEEAPEDGTPYARQDAGWVSVSSATGNANVRVIELSGVATAQEIIDYFNSVGNGITKTGDETIVISSSDYPAPTTLDVTDNGDGTIDYTVSGETTVTQGFEGLLVGIAAGDYGDGGTALTLDNVYGFPSRVDNITEIPNRSYNDLQDLPQIQTIEKKEIKNISTENYTIESEDINYFLVFENISGHTITYPGGLFSSDQYLKGIVLGTSEFVNSAAANTFTNGLTNRIKPLGSFDVRINSSNDTTQLIGDLIKEYDITTSPDGTLWKTGQVDNSGNPVAPTAL